MSMLFITLLALQIVYSTQNIIYSRVLNTIHECHEPLTKFHEPFANVHECSAKFFLQSTVTMATFNCIFPAGLSLCVTQYYRSHGAGL